MVAIRVNVTVPKEVLNSQAVVEALKRMLRTQTAPDLRQMFQGTTEGWKSRPGWFQRYEFQTGRLSAFVFPTGNAASTYALVNAGSPPHTIRRRRSPTLRFQTGYRPATTPRVLTSRAAARSGEVITPTQVRHPGFEAREFDATIAERYQPVFEFDVQNTINKAAR